MGSIRKLSLIAGYELLAFKIAADIDDEIALAHNLAERQSCHDCHPPAPPSCCHPGGKAGQADHRPVFHGWQQQMRRAAAAAKQHNCVKGKHSAANEWLLA